jgi:hypothetical protein
MVSKADLFCNPIRKINMNVRIYKLIILVAVTLTPLLLAGVASAQRSGQSMSIQTGVVVAAQGLLICIQKCTTNPPSWGSFGCK